MAALYDARRPCLADLVLQNSFGDIGALYTQHSGSSSHQDGISAENWCVMPRLGSRRYLAFDAGPIYSDKGELLAVVETLRDITAQKEAQTALEMLARVDGLTGVANRRMFDDVLEEECRRSSRDNDCVSLMMVDVDHFKLFNDVAGHQAGDECLKQIAQLIRGEMRPAGDFPARYGGEEFAVILPATPLAGAIEVAESIRTAIVEAAIPHPSPLASGMLTLSIGVAHVGAGASPEPVSLIHAADAALYQAKRQGRDRVIAAQQN